MPICWNISKKLNSQRLCWSIDSSGAIRSSSINCEIKCGIYSINDAKNSSSFGRFKYFQNTAHPTWNPSLVINYFVENYSWNVLHHRSSLMMTTMTAQEAWDEIKFVRLNQILDRLYICISQSTNWSWKMKPSSNKTQTHNQRDPFAL